MEGPLANGTGLNQGQMSDSPAPEEEPVDPKTLITDEDVKAALLSDKGEAELTSWEVVDFTKEGDNYSTFVTSIQVTYSANDEESQVSYVVKVNPCRNLEGFESITHALFEKEGNFYQTIVPDLNSALEEVGMEKLNVPGCYHVNLEAGHEQIYFEDLRERGFQIIDKRQALDIAHVNLVLKELAKLHAASRLLQEKSPGEAMVEKYDPILRDWFNQGEEANAILIPVLQAHFIQAGDILENAGVDRRVLDWIESLMPNLPDVISNNMQSDTFGSICHGDCWSSNMLFRYEEDTPVEVMLVDFQACHYATVASELNQFLYSAVTSEVRSENLEDFMNTYYSTYTGILEAGGIEQAFTEEELMDEFKEKNILGAIFAITCVPNELLDDNDTFEKTENEDEIEGIECDFWTRMKDSAGGSPMLGPRFLSTFEEFLVTGLIP
ncbi:uncharacterized protein [Palaemon carinicauda]|uniref:uncharacterized protein n=1 Tax=Palaemon carinicauda TaxID=392227 RepID=UPI0035B5843F